jgi:galactose mutarotase-like enzyme
VDAPDRYELVDHIPAGRIVPVEGEYDLRQYTPLGDRRLDDCYRCPAGTQRLRWGDLELWIESSESVGHAVVYTPEHAVCLEPQTCAVDAFNLASGGFEGTGMAVIEPGRPLVATTTWRWASAERRWQEPHEA